MVGTGLQGGEAVRRQGAKTMTIAERKAKIIERLDALYEMGQAVEGDRKDLAAEFARARDMLAKLKHDFDTSPDSDAIMDTMEFVTDHIERILIAFARRRYPEKFQ
jgi:hypothetical protein